jgi:hypothetical protein
MLLGGRRSRVAAERCAGLRDSRERRWVREIGAVTGPIGKISGRVAVGPVGQALSPGMPQAQGNSETWFLYCRITAAPQHFAALNFEAVFWPFSRVPLPGAAHNAAISPKSRRVDGFFTERVSFASL